MIGVLLPLLAQGSLQLFDFEQQLHYFLVRRRVHHQQLTLSGEHVSFGFHLMEKKKKKQKRFDRVRNVADPNATTYFVRVVPYFHAFFLLPLVPLMQHSGLFHDFTAHVLQIVVFHFQFLRTYTQTRFRSKAILE